MLLEGIDFPSFVGNVTPPYYAEPVWSFLIQLSLPMGQTEYANTYFFEGNIAFLARFYMNLALLFDEGEYKNSARSPSDDYIDTYYQIQSAISVAGYNGDNCLRRAICELQSITLGDSLVEDILSILINPVAKKKEKRMKKYAEAKKIGKKSFHLCQRKYESKCKISILKMIKDYIIKLEVKKKYNWLKRWQKFYNFTT